MGGARASKQIRRGNQWASYAAGLTGMLESAKELK